MTIRLSYTNNKLFKKFSQEKCSMAKNTDHAKMDETEQTKAFLSFERHPIQSEDGRCQTGG